jgi:hypothetical protein
MTNPDEFAKRMKRLGKTINVKADKSVVILASQIQSTVILATPVDTGRARNNWFATIGTPSNETIENEGTYDPSKRIRSNNSVIATHSGGKKIYISNNLPYIKKLNGGSSKQAPPAFVEKAVKAAKGFISSIKVVDDN